MLFRIFDSPKYPCQKMRKIKMNKSQMEMWYKNIFILFCLLTFVCESTFSQQATVKADTTHLYQKIENYSKRSKFTRFIYGLIFEPQIKNQKRIKKYNKQIHRPYSAFEGKIIRKINIETMDPFGYSIMDTISQLGFLSKTGNTLHIKTKHITIRNLLLIHQNQKFDSLLVKESERLVRSRGYIKDVTFFVQKTSRNSDSVDIFIREIDNWSLTPQFTASTTSSNTILITEENFLGTGHEFQDGFTKDISNGNNAFSTNYFVPNIRNTYISTTLHYEFDRFKNFNKSLVVDRPFYSPFAKWAGGVSFQGIHSVTVPLTLNYNTQDYWVGYAKRLFKGNTMEERTTKIISTARFLRIRFLEKPSELKDPFHHYANENFYLAGVGLSTRNYVQDKYIFKYGLTEDVPVGKVIGLTGGYQIKNNVKRLYLGAKVSTGNFYSWGYLSPSLEYETFFHASKAEEGLFTAKANYFTGLFEIWKWKMRQFIKPELTLGINRFPYDSLSLNDGYGLVGFKSTELSGTSRFLLSLQTQAYAPWNLIGFRFGPFLNFSLGVLGNEDHGFNHQRMYSQIGLGVLIKNENLIISTFQFSISFYPQIPGNGYNIFKTNSFQTTDFGFSGFEIGKPGSKVFQ